MPRFFMSPGLASKRYGSFRILQDGSLVYYDKIGFDNLLRCIEERQDPAEIINYLSGLGFNFDFEDVLDEGSVLINITQALNARRLTITTLVTTFLIKVILNVPFMNLFAKIHIPVYYAPTVVTLLSQLIGIGFLLYMINKNNL